MRILASFCLLIVLFSCKTEEVSTSTPKEIHLASTFLQEEDSTLFRHWSERNHIRVVVHYMSSDSLIHLLKTKAYNSGLDLIICNNLYDILRLNKAEVLQPYISETGTPFDSKQYNYFALGINPYIFSSSSDSVPLPKTYDELQKNKFKCELDRKNEVPMLSALLSRLGRQKAYNWIKTYNENKDEVAGSFSLKYYSDLKKKEQFIFPGQRVSGTMYNLIAAGIVRQSSNYTSAHSLISYYSAPNNNSYFCKKINVIDLSNPEDIRLYRENQEKLLQYYSMIDRMLNKLK